MKNILYIFILVGWVSSTQGQSLTTDSFCLANKYSFGDSARYTRPILADMDYDGKMDLILYDFNQKKIKYHKGNATSFDAIPYATTFTINAISIAVSGDLDGDYIQGDIAVLNNANGDITILSNNNGALTTYTTIPPPTLFSSATETATSIFVKELDNDQEQEIIVTVHNITNSGYYIIDNQGNGTFTTTSTNTKYLMNLPSSYTSVVDFGYFNTDSYLDMVYTTPNSNGNMSFILSNSSLPIYSPLTIITTTLSTINASCQKIISKDVDNDTDTDLLFLFSGTGGGLYEAIYDNITSTFTFNPNAKLLQLNATDFFIVDINKDNQLDYVAMNELTGQCYLNKGLVQAPFLNFAQNQHTFSVNTPSSASYNNHFAVNKFHNDELPSIIATGAFTNSGSIRIIKNFSYPVNITANNNAVSCSGSPVILSASTTNNITNGFYNWSTGANNTPTISTNATGMKSAKYHFNLTNGGSCALISNHINVTSATGTLPITSLSVSQSTNLCTTSSAEVDYTITATSSGTNNIWLYLDDSDDSIDTILYVNGNIIIDATEVSMTYTLISQLGGCYKTDTITVIAYESPEIFPDPSTDLCFGSSYTIMPAPSSAGGGVTGYSLTYGGNTYTTTGNPVFTATSTSVNSFSLVAFNNMCQSNTWLHTFNINPIPVINAVYTPTVCKNSSVTINYNNNLNYAYYTIASSGTTYTNNSFTNILTNTTQFTVSIIDNSTSFACQKDSTFIIHVISSPTIQITNAPTVCAGSAFNLTSVGTANSYTWAGGSAIGNNATTFVTEINSGSYIYTLTASNGTVCANSQATVNVVVSPSPTINLVSLTSASICAGSTVTLSVNGASTYLMKPNNIFSSTGNFVLTPTTTISYTITGTDLNGCVSNSQTELVKSIILSPNPTISINGNTVICSGETFSLTATGATSYTWNNQSGVNISNTASVTDAPTANSNYVVMGANGVCLVSKAIPIKVNIKPQVSITAPSYSICPVIETNTLTATSTNGNWNYTWQPSVLGTNSVTPSFTIGLANQTATITATDATTGCSSNATVIIYAKPLPVITTVPTNTTVCEGTNFQLNANGGVNYLWQQGNVVGSSFTASISSQQTYTVFGTGINGCVNFTLATVGVFPSQNVDAFATPNTLCIGNKAILSVTGGTPTVASYQGQVISPTTNSSYPITIIDNNGCLYDRTAIVTITNNCSSIPKAATAFSPNGNGINDNFYIEDINATNNKVYIYDRWGIKLFETENYHNINNAWNGTYNGKTVPSGTYFYIINLKDTNETQKGWVEITGN